jgi:hypothetical protein
VAAGETLQLAYTIRATDSDVSHATDDRTVVVTITGTNDAPVITADNSGTAGSNVHDLTEGNAALTDSGSLAVSDADVTNTVAASVAALIGGHQCANAVETTRAAFSDWAAYGSLVSCSSFR